MKRHHHRWKRVRGLHVSDEHDFCEFFSRGRRCQARRGYQDWNSCDQGLWFTAVVIAWKTMEPMTYESNEFFRLWHDCLLRGA